MGGGFIFFFFLFVCLFVCLLVVEWEKISGGAGGGGGGIRCLKTSQPDFGYTRRNTVHLITSQCLFTVPDISQYVFVWRGFGEN